MARDLEPERVAVGGDARGVPVWLAGELDELRPRRERVAVDVRARKRVAGDRRPGVVERRDAGPATATAARRDECESGQRGDEKGAHAQNGSRHSWVGSRPIRLTTNSL